MSDNQEPKIDTAKPVEPEKKQILLKDIEDLYERYSEKQRRLGKRIISKKQYTALQGSRKSARKPKPTTVRDTSRTDNIPETPLNQEKKKKEDEKINDLEKTMKPVDPIKKKVPIVPPDSFMSFGNSQKNHEKTQKTKNNISQFGWGDHLKNSAMKVGKNMAIDYGIQLLLLGVMSLGTYVLMYGKEKVRVSSTRRRQVRLPESSPETKGPTSMPTSNIRPSW